MKTEEKETLLKNYEGELWGAIEAQIGVMGRHFRESCRADIISDLEDADYYDGEPQGWAESLKYQREAIIEYIKKAKAYMEDKVSKSKQQKAVEPKESITKKTYRKCLEDRIHILDFCFEFISEGIRPNWEEITAQWNKKHLVKIAKGTLKAAFSKAKKDKQTMLNWALTQIGPIEIKWTGRTQESESVTVRVPDVKAMRIKEPPINQPTDIPSVPDAETIRRLRAEQTAKRIEKEKGEKSL